MSDKIMSDTTNNILSDNKLKVVLRHLKAEYRGGFSRYPWTNEIEVEKITNHCNAQTFAIKELVDALKITLPLMEGDIISCQCILGDTHEGTAEAERNFDKIKAAIAKYRVE